MDKLINFISEIVLNVVCLIAPPSSKDIEEFKKQQPETSHPVVFGIALLLALLILFVGFIFLAFY